MGSRTWIKVYCDKWLQGSISEEPIHIRGIWITLLTLAGNGKYGDSGKIMALDGVGFYDKQLAAMLKVSLEMWVGAKKRLVKTGRIILAESNIIIIANWRKYQSEYERTAKYRSKDTPLATTNGTPREERREKREERRENNPPTPLSLSSSPDIFVLYNEEIGTLTETIRNTLLDAVEHYGEDWLRDAIKEAVLQGHRNWKYIAGILENWREEGRGEHEKEFPMFTEGNIDAKAQEIWKTALSELQPQVTNLNYHTWLEKTTGITYRDQEFIIGVPNVSVAEYLDQNQRSLIERVLVGYTQPGILITFAVEKNNSP